MNKIDLIDSMLDLKGKFESMMLMLEIVEDEYYLNNQLDPAAAIKVLRGEISKGHGDYDIGDLTVKVCYEYQKLMGYIQIVSDYVRAGRDITQEALDDYHDSKASQNGNCQTEQKPSTAIM